METLYARVQRDGPLDKRDAVGWAIRLAKRVEELHLLGVAHGGLSAHALLSDSSSCFGRGMLGDARHASTRPAYHSPERHDGEGISPADDTWAIAVTLYYTLTGSMPFHGVTSPEIRQRIATAPAAPLAVFDAGDDELQRILDQSLARDRAQRVRSAGDLVRALTNWFPAPGGANLPALDDGEDDSHGDFEDDEDDDDDDDVRTVMRDFTDVRAQLAAAGAMQSPAAAPGAARPAGPAAPVPVAAAHGAAPPSGPASGPRPAIAPVLAPPGAAGLGAPPLRPRAPTALGGFGLPPGSGGRPSPAPASPGAAGLGPAMRPPMTTPLGGARAPAPAGYPAPPGPAGGSAMAGRSGMDPAPATAPGRGIGPGPAQGSPMPLGAGPATPRPGYPPAPGAGQPGGAAMRPAAPPLAPAAAAPAGRIQGDDALPVGPAPRFDMEDDESDDAATMLIDADQGDLSDAIAYALAVQGGQRPPTPAAGRPAGPGGSPPGWPEPERPVSGDEATQPAPYMDLGGPPPATQPVPHYPMAAGVGPNPGFQGSAVAVSGPAMLGPDPRSPAAPSLGPAGPVVPPIEFDTPSSGSGLRTALIFAVVLLVLVIAAVVLLYLHRQGTINLGIAI